MPYLTDVIKKKKMWLETLIGRWMLCVREDLRQGVGDDEATKRKRDEMKPSQNDGGEFILEALLKFSSFWDFYRCKSNSTFTSNLYCHISWLHFSFLSKTVVILDGIGVFKWPCLRKGCQVWIGASPLPFLIQKSEAHTLKPCLNELDIQRRGWRSSLNTEYMLHSETFLTWGFITVPNPLCSGSVLCFSHK